MQQVRMKTGPYKGQVVPVRDHEVGSLVSSGQAERILPASIPEIEGERTSPEVRAPRAPRPKAPAKKSTKKS